MNESNSPSSTEISDQIAALQRHVFTLLLVLVVVSGTLVAYLYYQSRVLGENLVSIRQQSKPLIQAYNQDGPIVQNFVDQLRVYSVTHPDFAQQVLKKYNIPATKPTPAKK